MTSRLPEQPPPPIPCVLPFQAPWTPPVPPSATLSGKPDPNVDVLVGVLAVQDVHLAIRAVRSGPRSRSALVADLTSGSPANPYAGSMASSLQAPPPPGLLTRAECKRPGCTVKRQVDRMHRTLSSDSVAIASDCLGSKQSPPKRLVLVLRSVNGSSMLRAHSPHELYCIEARLNLHGAREVRADIQPFFSASCSPSRGSRRFGRAGSSRKRIGGARCRRPDSSVSSSSRAASSASGSVLTGA